MKEKVVSYGRQKEEKRERKPIGHKTRGFRVEPTNSVP